MSERTPGDGVTAAATQVAESILRELVRSLSVVDEPRFQRGIRHPLVNVLTIAVVGCMCGCDDAEALEDWGKKEANWLARIRPSRSRRSRAAGQLRPAARTLSAGIGCRKTPFWLNSVHQQLILTSPLLGPGGAVMP
jgi:hypothetical protein